MSYKTPHASVPSRIEALLLAVGGSASPLNGDAEHLYE